MLGRAKRSYAGGEMDLLVENPDQDAPKDEPIVGKVKVE